MSNYKEMKRFIKQKNIDKKGFTLVETLVAISIFSMTIVAVMVVLGGGISDTNYAKTKMTASYLAQEGIEYVRNMRDSSYILADPDMQTGWSNFKVAVDSVTFPKVNSNFYPTDPDFSDFTRTLRVDTVNTDELKISSTVTWTQKSGTFSITLTEELFNWVE